MEVSSATARPVPAEVKVAAKKPPEKPKQTEEQEAPAVQNKPKPKPVVNAQGQTTGRILNATA